MLCQFDGMTEIYPATVFAYHGCERSNEGNRHYLDATVINTALALAEDEHLPFDTVRAAYIEGSPIFDGSAFMEDTHIQNAVRNPASIIAFFRPRGLDAYIKALK